MILEVLQNHYPDEYTMLEFLALDDHETFIGLANDSREYTNHLIGYGLIENVGNRYDFRIEVIRKYLERKSKYKRLVNSPEEMWAEISSRRNAIEPKIRRIVRNQLRIQLGDNEAKKAVLKLMGPNKENKYGGLAYNDLFDPNLSEIYWEDLRVLINKNWAWFKNILGQDAERFNTEMRAINQLRKDAHAAIVSNDELNYFRVCMSRLEKLVDDFLV